jgi:hypothetical protein
MRTLKVLLTFILLFSFLLPILNSFTLHAASLTYQLPWEYGVKATYIRGSINSNQSLEHGKAGSYDFVVANGNVTAAKDGTIVYVNDTNTKNVTNGDYWVYWNSVVIKHGTNEYSSYHHLKTGSVPTWIKQACTQTYSKQNCNVAIKAGQVIGIQGNTGYSTGTHLHVQFGTIIAFSNKSDFYDQDRDGNKTEKVYSGYTWNLRDVGFTTKEGTFSAAQVNQWKCQTRYTSTNGSTVPPVDPRGDFPTIADVNGDGKGDFIVFEKATNAVGVVLSTGTTFGGGIGGYQVWNSNTKYGSDWTLLHPADVNGDKRADLIAFNPTTMAVDVTLSTGTNFGGGYAGYQVWNTNTKYGSDWVLLDPADVNGDGLADLIAFQPSTNKVNVTLSTGTNFGGGYAGSQVWNSNTKYGPDWTLLDPADVNRDDKADLIAFQPSTNKVNVTLSTGTNFGGGVGGFQVWNTNTKYGADWNLLPLADANGDRRADLIAFQPSTTKINVTLSKGTNFGGGLAGFQVWNLRSKYTINQWKLLPPTDVTGDRKADIIAYNATTYQIDVTPSTGTNFGGGDGGYQVWNSNIYQK